MIWLRGPIIIIIGNHKDGLTFSQGKADTSRFQMEELFKAMDGERLTEKQDSAHYFFKVRTLPSFLQNLIIKRINPFVYLHNLLELFLGKAISISHKFHECRHVNE